MGEETGTPMENGERDGPTEKRERERQDNSHCSAVDALEASASSKPFGSPGLSSNQSPAVNELPFGVAIHAGARSSRNPAKCW